MEIFSQNIGFYEKEIKKYSRLLNRVAVLRIFVFVMAAILIIFFADRRQMAWMILTVLTFLIIFIWLIVRYNRISYRKYHYFFLKEINQSELRRLDNNLSGFDGGENFIGRDHPYVSDLDIFGNHSLFQLLDRTATGPGKACLAQWLSGPAELRTLPERQEAVKELVPRLEWRQDLQATGLHFRHIGSGFGLMPDWIKKPERIYPRRVLYLLTGMVLAISSTATLVFSLIHLKAANPAINLLPLFIVLMINFLVLRNLKPVAEELLENMHGNLQTLEAYRAMILKIEAKEFKSARLQELQAAFSAEGYKASRKIGKLVHTMDIFLQRGVRKEMVAGNVFYGLLNAFWLLDLYCILLAEKWKIRNRDRLHRWSASVSEFEALMSLAGFAYANPGYSFPEITGTPYHIHFRDLGHPLIQITKRVCNDFEISGQGKIAIITGSNMAGKSTFLRSVGVNMVLAYAGAPVCAESGKLPVVKIFTGMRTQDNLEEGISSFYAELKRIEMLLDITGQGEPVFFLLDEMFKGTNSEDRHKGGYSLIRQLGGLNALGLVATHDLGLARLAEKDLNVSNSSFHSGLDRGNMVFDYRLKPGICQDFNASELMKRSGINILPDLPDDHPSN